MSRRRADPRERAARAARERGRPAPARLRRRLVRVTGLVAACAAALVLGGFLRISFSPGGPGFRWTQVPVSFVVQRDASADVADGSDRAAVRLAFRAWEDLSDSSAAFREDTAADASRRDFDADDIHLVVWDEDGSSGLFPPGSGIIALTPILAATGDGAILDADVVVNGALPFSTTGDPNAFDVQAVVTHEVGHFLGFDHSGGPLATMHPSVARGAANARSLDRDDDAAAATVYPVFAGRARIAGAVTRQGGGGLRLAHVVAVDAGTGEYAADAVSDGQGNYALEGLLPGTYELYAEPLDGPIHPNDTIPLAGQPADAFATTWFPGGAVTVGPGASGSASWTAGPDAGLNVDDSAGATLVAGGAGGALVLAGPGVGAALEVRVTGPGVSAGPVERLGPDAVRVVLQADPAAPGVVRCVEVRDALLRTAVLTAGVDVVADAPRLTAVSPTSLRAAGGDLLTLDGERLAERSAVLVGGALASDVRFVSDARLTCVSPPAQGQAGPVEVVVIRPDGREARLPAAVTYDLVPAPRAIDPALGPTAGGTEHVVSGTGFAAGARVLLGDTAATVLSASGEELRILLPPRPAGTVDVRVELGGQAGFLPGAFTYVDAVPPRIVSFSPTAGDVAGGTPVTIVGSGFEPGAEVTFGGVAAASALAVSASELACTTPAHAAGAVEVRVRNPSSGLVATTPVRFSYVQPVPLPTDVRFRRSAGCGLAPHGDGGAGAGAARLAGLLGLAACCAGLAAARRRASRQASGGRW